MFAESIAVRRIYNQFLAHSQGTVTFVLDETDENSVHSKNIADSFAAGGDYANLSAGNRPVCGVQLVETVANERWRW